MTTNRMGLEQALSDGELTVITETDHVQCGDAAAMARELLAYRKASKKAVAYIDELELNRIKDGDSGVIRTPIYGAGYQDASIPLYAAPPQTVTVPDAIEPDYDVIKGILPTSNPDEYACCIAADMWNACRAAMLKSVTNEP